MRHVRSACCGGHAGNLHQFLDGALMEADHLFVDAVRGLRNADAGDEYLRGSKAAIPMHQCMNIAPDENPRIGQRSRQRHLHDGQAKTRATRAASLHHHWYNRRDHTERHCQQNKCPAHCRMQQGGVPQFKPRHLWPSLA